MKNPETWLATSMEDIVFENRNKAYGAYRLRKEENTRMLIALFAGFVLSVLVAFYMLTHRPENILKPVVNTIIDVVNVKPVELPKVDVHLPKAPQPPAEATNTIAFKTIRPDDHAQAATDEVPTVQQLKDKVIGVETNNNNNNNQPAILKEPQIKSPAAAVKDETVHAYAEVPPAFIPDYNALQHWINTHINYPSQALKMGIEGTVYVTFVVNADGSISDAQVLRGIGFGCDEEAIRAVESMPRWKPGMQNKMAVRVKQTLPIKFELER